MTPARSLLVAAAAALLVTVATLQSSQAATFKVIYSFCNKNTAGCPDGASPSENLFMDSAGSLYGTTTYMGGPQRYGTVFKLQQNAAKTKWIPTVLHTFCQMTECVDGFSVYTDLIRDAAGNLFGTTRYGGTSADCDSVSRSGCGTAFQLVYNKAARSYTHKNIYAFCPYPTTPPFCTVDGDKPMGGVIMDDAGALYGTTYAGGTHTSGTVFKLVPNAAKTRWTSKLLYSFCHVGDYCDDGWRPQGALLADDAGNLYGTTSEGGTGAECEALRGCGTVFALLYNKSTKKYAHKVIYNFCAKADCADGLQPMTTLVADTAGNLYGTAWQGGAHAKGVVFKLTPNATKTKWTYKTLHSFCAAANCTDGATPTAKLAVDGAGNVFGTTTSGGANNNTGTLFQLVYKRTTKTYVHKVVRNFCMEANCTDGSYPHYKSGVIIDADGNLYGTTNGGGLYGNWGTVFQLAK